MAIVKGPVQFTGSMGNISFYTRKGSDKIIARTKGGAKKEKIKSSAKFEGFRLQQNEWKGCTRFASTLRYAFGGLHRVADYNLTAVLNGFAKNIQKTDETGEVGKRAIRLSKFPFTLDGFNFNRNYPLTTVLGVSPYPVIDREKCSAKLLIPRINTEIDLLNVQRLPYFRLVVSLGAVSDVVWNEEAKEFQPIVADLHGVSIVITGEWLPSENILQEQTIEVEMDHELKSYFTNEVSLVLSMAVEFGKVGFTGEVQEVKYAASGKVMKVG
ncbi:MAG: hypothetical protein GZ091_07690 [Paludibacter sp.]|nr:hypothetical protein [Paludibacter sp.]